MKKQTNKPEKWFMITYANTNKDYHKADSYDNAVKYGYKEAAEQKTALLFVKEVYKPNK